MSLRFRTITAVIALVVGWSGNATAALLGRCRFDSALYAFVGTPSEQAACLLRTVRVLGRVDATLAVLPPNLSRLIGKAMPFDKAKLHALLARANLRDADVGGSLDESLAHGAGGAAGTPVARYFVIHDTSFPSFGTSPFPTNVDTSDFVNRLSSYRKPSDAKAHAFVNRRGEIYIGHGFGTPWRATKLERAIGIAAKGMFLHIELIQPRRAHPNMADGNAPEPGFSVAQYDRLALLYLAAGLRRGEGLVPAFHASIDEGLRGGHDDPQHFDLAAFDAALGRLLRDIG